jgi:hypothetical protein
MKRPREKTEAAKRAEGVVVAERYQRAEVAEAEGRQRLALLQPWRHLAYQVQRLLARDLRGRRHRPIRAFRHESGAVAQCKDRSVVPGEEVRLYHNGTTSRVSPRRARSMADGHRANKHGLSADDEPDHHQNRQTDEDASKKMSRPSMTLMHGAPHGVSSRAMEGK